MVTLSFTIFSGQKNYNRAHMLFQVLCGLEPIFYTTHPNEEPEILLIKTTGSQVVMSLPQNQLAACDFYHFHISLNFN